MIAPENTLTAFGLAIKKGFKAVECDVQLTHDGELVVIHDLTVQRTTNGTGWVSKLDLNVLQSFNTVEGEHVPTLQEVFDLVVVKSNKKIIVELKGDTHLHAIKVARSLADFLRSIDKKYTKNVEVHSFWYEAVRELKLLYPEIVTAVILSGGFTAKQIIEIVGDNNANGVSLNYAYLSPKIVRLCHAHGIFVDTYAISDGTVMKRLRPFGINAIVENFTGNVI